MDSSERLKIMYIVAGALGIVLVVGLTLSGLDRALRKPETAAVRPSAIAASVGAKHDFYVFDFSSDNRVKVATECVAVGKHSVIYKELSVKTAPTLIARITEEFDENIFPVNRELLENGGMMGLNNGSRVNILLLDAARGRPANVKRPTVAGYYSQENERLQAYKTESNQAKIIHVFIGGYGVSEDDVAETVAHETRHLKNWAITKSNVGLSISSLFAIATVLTLYLGLSHLYARSFQP